MIKLITAMLKQQVYELIIVAKQRLKTNRAVGNHCGVSDSTISLILNKKWDDISDGMWKNLAIKLNYRPTDWNLTTTMNSRTLEVLYRDSQINSMWFAISNPAGSGKTATAQAYTKAGQPYVFYIQCREWSRREFVIELARTVGADTTEKRVNINSFLNEVVKYFKQHRNNKNMIIIDEADKLRPAALGLLIALYNELEDIVGVVIQGTENLKKQIERGVAYQKKGYDEIHSRFGRRFMTLPGCVLEDVRRICFANGIYDNNLQKKIYQECGPLRITWNGQNLRVIRDMRQLKRIIKREKMLLNDIDQEQGQEQEQPQETLAAV